MRDMICRDCRTQASLPDARKRTPIWQLVLLLVLIALSLVQPLFWLVTIPWAIYRTVADAKDRKTPACPSCGHRALIPVESPEGQRLANVA